MSIKDEILKRFKEIGSFTTKNFCSLHSIKSNHLRSQINKLRKKGFAIGNFKDENGDTGYYSRDIDKNPFNLKEQDFIIKRQEKKTPYFKLFTENTEFKFINIGDVHLDNKFKKNELIKDLNRCREEGIFVFLNGDIFEMATRYSVGAGVYVSAWNNQKQFDEILNIVLEYRDIIIMILEGNHERRAYKEIGISPLSQIAKMANIPFVTGRAYVDICTPATTRKITITHDVGSSAQTSRGKIHAVYKKVRIHKFCHFYLGNHLHDGLSDENLFHTEEEETTGKIVRVREYALMNPSFLSYFDSYGDHKGYNMGTGIWRYCFIDDEEYGIRFFKFQKYVE